MMWYKEKIHLLHYAIGWNKHCDNQIVIWTHYALP